MTVHPYRFTTTFTSGLTKHSVAVSGGENYCPTPPGQGRCQVLKVLIQSSNTNLKRPIFLLPIQRSHQSLFLQSRAPEIKQSKKNLQTEFSLHNCHLSRLTMLTLWFFHNFFVFCSFTLTRVRLQINVDPHFLFWTFSVLISFLAFVALRWQI